MSYLDKGFSTFLYKTEPKSIETTEDIASLSTPTLAGTVLAGGQTLSQDGKMIVDWEKGKIYRTDGAYSYNLTKDGIFLGAEDINDAPFSVNMEGEMSAKSATFKTDNDTTIIDGTGLVSVANFDADEATPSSGEQLSVDDAWTDVTDLTHTVTLSRSSYVLFGLTAELYATGYSHGDTWGVSLALNIGGTLYPRSDVGWGNVANISSNGGGDDFTGIILVTSPTHMIQLGSGTHTCKIQYYVDSGSVNVNPRITAHQFWYLVLGS